MAVLFRGILHAAPKDQPAPTTAASSRRRERNYNDKRVNTPIEIRNRMEVKHRSESENDLKVGHEEISHARLVSNIFSLSETHS